MDWSFTSDTWTPIRGKIFFGKTSVYFLVLSRQYLNLLKMLQNMFSLDFRIISQEVNMVIGRFVDIISSSKLISSIFYLLRTGRDWLLPADWSGLHEINWEWEWYWMKQLNLECQTDEINKNHKEYPQSDINSHGER